MMKSISFTNSEDETIFSYVMPLIVSLDFGCRCDMVSTLAASIFVTPARTGGTSLVEVTDLVSIHDLD